MRDARGEAASYFISKNGLKNFSLSQEKRFRFWILESKATDLTTDLNSE